MFLPLLLLAFPSLASPPVVQDRGPEPKQEQGDAQDAPKPDPFLALVKEYAQAKSKWAFARRNAVTEEQKAEHKARHPVIEYWPRVEALVAAGDGRGLVWMAEAVDDKFSDRAELLAKKSECVATLLAKHADEAWAATEVVHMLARQRSWYDEAWVRKQIETLATQSKNAEVQAAAWFEFAKRLDSSRASAEEKARAAEVRAKIAKDFAGTSAARALAQKASNATLAVDSPAPDFDAVDPDGVAFKLSDYRGKVVMLDFWGFW